MGAPFSFFRTVTLTAEGNTVEYKRIDVQGVPMQQRGFAREFNKNSVLHDILFEKDPIEASPLKSNSNFQLWSRADFGELLDALSFDRESGYTLVCGVATFPKHSNINHSDVHTSLPGYHVEPISDFAHMKKFVRVYPSLSRFAMQRQVVVLSS